MLFRSVRYLRVQQVQAGLGATKELGGQVHLHILGSEVTQRDSSAADGASLTELQIWVHRQLLIELQSYRQRKRVTDAVTHGYRAKERAAYIVTERTTDIAAHC